MGEKNTPLTGTTKPPKPPKPTKPTKPTKPAKPAKKVSTWVQRVVSSLHSQSEIEASLAWLDLDEDLRHFRHTLQTVREANTPESRRMFCAKSATKANIAHTSRQYTNQQVHQATQQLENQKIAEKATTCRWQSKRCIFKPRTN